MIKAYYFSVHSGQQSEVLMIKKKFVKSRNIYKVTFILPKTEWPQEVSVEQVFLVGEFNNWDQTATPMKRDSKGNFRATLELEPGRELQFRYLVNGQHWCNEWHADGYHPNQLGDDNCVVFLPDNAD